MFKSFFFSIFTLALIFSIFGPTIMSVLGNNGDSFLVLEINENEEENEKECDEEHGETHFLPVGMVMALQPYAARDRRARSGRPVLICSTPKTIFSPPPELTA